MDFVTLVDRNHSLLAEAAEARAKTRRLCSRTETSRRDELEWGCQPSQHWPLDWSRFLEGHLTPDQVCLELEPALTPVPEPTGKL
jgi:hypothetical protein